MFSTIIYEKKEAIGIIYLNRPEVLNAMNRTMWSELDKVLTIAEEDPEIRVLIFTGRGRAFSSGADLKESPKRTKEQYREYLEQLQKVSLRLIEFPKPTIAAINGYALGSGYEFALACDIRIASEDALLGSPEAKVSSSVTGGATKLLVDLVGSAKAKELIFTADFINGKEAERIGLVNKVVKSENLMEEAISMAKKIAQNSFLSIKLIKKLLNIARETSLSSIMQYEIEACLNTVFSDERLERIRQFEQRKKGEEE
jgi:enoyl-CoA hydratase